ncbi:esterase family protein [Actinomadura craniellae]|uniref:Esterase family protein n=1 Tax=Actinomadura craniellae TaxID=2231787 RepID=A0A365H785_9ACTN|nr:alpha/beta hydrolase-fold protein [Actinomadura craniellae]RAY14878.1 esterase family protein [Actinomadura craniellae]
MRTMSGGGAPSRGTRRAAFISAAALGVAVTPGLAGSAQAAPTFKAASNGSTIHSYKWLNSYTFDFTVQSKALASRQNVRVLIPKGWQFYSNQSWPVVYAYHGGADNYLSWTRSTSIETLANRYGVMVVMPEGGTNGSYTNWYNSGRGGNPQWETFHLDEVRELVERNYHAGSARATLGISSGAQGACTYPGRRPGSIRYATCLSGVLSMQAPGVPLLLWYTNLGGDFNPDDIWGPWPWAKRNWDAHDPIKLLPRMRTTKFYISAGTTGKQGPLDAASKAPWDIGYLSEPPIGRTVQDFAAEARRQGISVEANVYGNGSHSWPYWRRELNVAWPKMMAAIGARQM